MSAEPAPTTSACPHPEAVGRRWGDPITPEREAELQSRLDDWEALIAERTQRTLAEMDLPWGQRTRLANDEKVGPFEEYVLTGADAFWLAQHEADRLEVQRIEDESYGIYTYYQPELNLQGADLHEAHLEGASLGEAHLGGASLREAYLEGADLREAKMVGSICGRAHLEGANLSGARLDAAQFTGAHLKGANLNSAHLKRAKFDDADLEEATLIGAHLEEGGTYGRYLKWVEGIS
jgi:hypothetical protein